VSGVAERLLVLAYPEAAPADRAWIEAIRAAHDPASARVHAHFTLVYPTQALAAAQLIAHVRAVARAYPAFPFVLRAAIPYPDGSGPEKHVFLMPDAGFGALVRLHERLYSGPLASDRRLDMPTVPHITVARLTDPARSRDLAAELNARDWSIPGTVTALTVVRDDGVAVRALARVPLGQSDVSREEPVPR